MIRYLTPRDHAAYRLIRERALDADPDAFGETLAALQARSDAELEAWLSERIVPGRGAIACAEGQGRILGMCGFSLAEDEAGTAVFWGLFVEPEARLAGTGRRLLSEAEAWASSHGAVRMRARVAITNDGAARFYEACGYAAGETSGTLRRESAVPLRVIRRDLDPRVRA